MHFRIKENPKAFVVPIIDVIDDKTLEYYHGNGNYFQVWPNPNFKSQLVELEIKKSYSRLAVSPGQATSPGLTSHLASWLAGEVQ